MRRGLFYPKLALQNMVRNRRFCLPYLLTGLLTVAMFYNMIFLTTSEDIKNMPGSGNLGFILFLGTIVVSLFSVIFILYTNSFLMKRRQKELGLYNILGMEKKHIANMLLWETFYTGIVSIIGGLLAGILLSKLLLLALFRLLFFQVHFGFSVNPVAVAITAALFAGIYLLTLLFNFFKLCITNPVDLLKGGNVGEKEPKSKWLLTIIGLAALGTGYYIALVTESPLNAIMLFFVAVILVIIGTYCLFTSGSIVLLKQLKKNKKYYYKAKHFTAISGMLYRMKQNAVGLANICILSTMVLVMVSTSVCMYVGVEDALDTRFPEDISFELSSDQASFELDQFQDAVLAEADKAGLEVVNLIQYKSISFATSVNDSVFELKNPNDMYYSRLSYAEIMTTDEYEKLTGHHEELKPDQVLIYCKTRYNWDSVTFHNKQYTVAKWLDEFSLENFFSSYVNDVFYIVVADNDVINDFYKMQLESYKKNASNIDWYLSFDLNGDENEIISCYKNMLTVAGQYKEGTVVDENGKRIAAKPLSFYSNCKQANRTQFYALYGGLLFLGLFLGALFLMATVLIIYYKQISEGYDDKDRFEIMQKVGMSQDEVKSTIKSQILTVFFLPLICTIIHLAAAFKMITRLMVVLNLYNVGLFAICTLGTIAVFAIGYAIIYKLTARTYYKIVR